MKIHYALAGNPNSGKTTLFNSLTGSNQTVGNWPGVTVEKKQGSLKGARQALLTDLPGIYSLSPYTLEEEITRDFLLDETPDVLINLVDATNLERNLYLTTQLLELSIPMVVALNRMDIVEKRGDSIRSEELASALGCPVVEISALKEKGLENLLEAAAQAAKENRAPVVHRFCGGVEHAIAHIEEALLHDLPEGLQRFYAIKLFERDRKAAARLALTEEALAHIEADIRACEKELGDDGESIIANERYGLIARLTTGKARFAASPKTGWADRIDSLLTHRFLALPIFALIMFAVYFISVSTLGAWLTGFMADVVFGQGINPAAEGFLTSINTAPWLVSLILDGIIGGVGAVLGFVPQMLVLFAMLAFLEGSGYMARIGFIMDRVFRRIGLSGKSIIPMLIGTGCGVPGILASRTIESDRDRKMTMITTTFMPCSAKLPVIALIAGALFQGAWWVAPSAYFAGAGAVVLSGLILKRSRLFAGSPAPFVLELPPYQLPRAIDLARTVADRASAFVRKAGTVILISSVAIWVLTNVGFHDGNMVLATDLEDGALAALGGFIAPVFAPLGFGDWQSSVATITGLFAKENVVGTFGVLFGFGAAGSGDAGAWAALSAHFTPLAAYSFLIFNLLCAPCIAAIGAIRKEMNNWKWTLIAVGYQTGFAYGLSLVVYQMGRLAAGESFGPGTAAALALIAAVAWHLFKKEKQAPGRLTAPDCRPGRKGACVHD